MKGRREDTGINTFGRNGAMRLCVPGQRTDRARGGGKSTTVNHLYLSLRPDIYIQQQRMFLFSFFLFKSSASSVCLLIQTHKSSAQAKHISVQKTVLLKV